MSGDEKAAQIGESVQAYQAAKVECAHIEQKVKQVFRAYIDAGESMDERKGTITEPQLVNGVLKIGWRDGDPLKHLMNEKELTIIVQERDQARKKLAAAKQLMNSLGITGVG
jgi:hypothetical protein